jgi:flagellin-like protein
MRPKRGMAPLVATVLLIAFAIALGVVVMSFGSTYYENTRYSGHELNATELCASVELAVFELQGQEQLCQGGDGPGGHVSFVIVNKGVVPIYEVQLWVVGQGIYVSDVANSTLQPGQPLEVTEVYDYDRYGGIRQVQLIPKVEVKGNPDSVFCFDQAVKRDSVRVC